MYSALYYPHLTIGDSSLLRTALLLWDELDFIIPWETPRVWSEDNNKDVDAALELIAKPIQPTIEQQAYAHRLIEDLATSDLPRDFQLNQDNKDNEYLMYVEKFSRETWQILEDLNLIIPGEHHYDWRASKNLGLRMMAILAESCAGATKRTVTDKTKAYNTLNESIAHLHGGSYGTVSDTVERLITISVGIIDADQFTLKELIEFRRNEAKENGHQIREMRHNYLEKIDGFVSSISDEKNTQSDIIELERQFKIQMEDDLKFLKDGLKKNASDTLFSKEVGVGILAAAGMAITPWAGLAGVASLIKTAKNYREDRKKVLGQHAMSWLFSIREGNSFFSY